MLRVIERPNGLGWLIVDECENAIAAEGAECPPGIAPVLAAAPALLSACEAALPVIRSAIIGMAADGPAKGVALGKARLAMVLIESAIASAGRGEGDAGQGG